MADCIQQTEEDALADQSQSKRADPPGFSFPSPFYSWAEQTAEAKKILEATLVAYTSGLIYFYLSKKKKEKKCNKENQKYQKAETLY